MIHAMRVFDKSKAVQIEETLSLKRILMLEEGKLPKTGFDVFRLEQQVSLDFIDEANQQF